MSDLVSIFTKIKDSIVALGDQLLLLPARIDSIVFDENFVITRFLALIHYILGTPLYLLFCTMLLIGAGFILYHIAKTLLSLFEMLFPKLKGRILLP